MSDDRFSEENKQSFTKYPRIKHKTMQGHFSRQAPGTPVQWETIFLLMKANKTDSVPFRWMRKLLRNYTDEFIWEAYEYWLSGKVHEKIV